LTGVGFCGLDLAHPIVNGSGTYDAIAARRAFGDALVDAFPFSAFVSKTITLKPRDGNPPPRLFETPAGMINSIGLPNKGLEGYLAHDLPELARLPVPLITNVMGATGEEIAALVEAVDARAEIDAVELNVSCPNVKTGLDIGADPVELGSVVRRVRALTTKPRRRRRRRPRAPTPSRSSTRSARTRRTPGSPAPPGSGAGPAGCPARPSGRSRSHRYARSRSGWRSRSSGWAASRPAGTPPICSTRAQLWSPSAPRASAIRPRDAAFDGSFTICSQRAGRS
jgi:dihydroorotate dehydrogenase